MSEGGFIHDGVDVVLDGLRNRIDDQMDWLKGQEKLERKNSGNVNLRIQYHRTFGYFLSVSKSKASQVPDHWIRRQTLANEERFVTPQLKEREGKIFQLKARCASTEYEIFCKLRQLVGKKASVIRDLARAVASLDSIVGLAEVAATSGYPESPRLNDPITINLEPKENLHIFHSGTDYRPNGELFTSGEFSLLRMQRPAGFVGLPE